MQYVFGGIQICLSKSMKRLCAQKDSIFIRCTFAVEDSIPFVAYVSSKIIISLKGLAVRWLKGMEKKVFAYVDGFFAKNDKIFLL